MKADVEREYDIARLPYECRRALDRAVRPVELVSVGDVTITTDEEHDEIVVLVNNAEEARFARARLRRPNLDRLLAAVAVAVRQLPEEAARRDALAAIARPGALVFEAPADEDVVRAWLDDLLFAEIPRALVVVDHPGDVSRN